MLEFEELIRSRVIPQLVDDAEELAEGETVDGTWTPKQIMIIIIIMIIMERGPLNKM